MKRLEIAFGVLKVPLDFCMVVLGFLLGYHLRIHPRLFESYDHSILSQFAEYLSLSFSFAIVLVVVFSFFGLYSFKNTERSLGELRKVVTYSVIWVLIMTAYFFATRELFFSRLILGLSAVTSVLLISSGRLLMNGLQLVFLRAGYGRRDVVFYGSNSISRELAKRFKKDPHYNVVGTVKSMKELEKLIKKRSFDSIVQCSQGLQNQDDQALLEFCQAQHLEYRFVPNILAIERSNVNIETFGDYPLIHLKPTPLDGWGKIYKRSFDIFGSIAALILLSPILLLIALLIKVDSRGPVLFSKVDDGSPAYRIGQEGKKFVFYKFRTMKPKSHNKRYKELADQNHRKEGPLVKIKNDPRITRFGRVLRRTSLDELPQLWNVLRGDMSLVGPRPHLPEEVEQYEKHHKFLLTIKPGLTGLSQTSGRSDLSFEKEVRLETYYIKQWSPWLDFKILLKTVIVVLSGNAAD